MGHLVNSGTADLLFQIVQCWRACEVNEEGQDLPMVIYCSGIMYKHYSYLGFPQIKHNSEGKYVHNEIFNNIPYLI